MTENQAMLVVAEQTAKELGYIKVISERIKCSLSGMASFICDRHIKETQIKGGNTIRMSHEQAVIDFATSEGFRISYDYNSYGVRYIIFTL
jgi:hypothetical protein